MAQEMRRRALGHEVLSQATDEVKPRSHFGGPRSPGSILVRNLPYILVAQLLVVILILVDPLGLRSTQGTIEPPQPMPEGMNKALWGISDVEVITKRMAVNNTILMLVCPKGYEKFVENWFLVASQHSTFDGRFLILAEDFDTFTQLNRTYPKNVVYRMDLKEPFPDAGACTSPNNLTLAALQSAYRKVSYTREIMNTGPNVFLNDVTAVWAKDPYPHFVSNDVFLTLGDVNKTGGDQLLVDYPNTGITKLKEPLPRGVGRLPPLSDEVLYMQNNVGTWVTLDYWAVVIEALFWKECNRTVATEEGTDPYTTGASIAALQGGVHNTVHLSPRPLIGLMPPGKFPPPTVFFGNPTWRSLIEDDVVIVRSKLGVTTKEAMISRLQSVGLWKLETTEPEEPTK